MGEPTVTVRSDASLRARPDEARIDLEVWKVERHSEDAHADVARRSQALDTLLDELAIPKEQRTTAGVSVRAENEWSGSRWQRKGWRASNRILVRLTDISIAGKLIGEAVDRAEATVAGPWWSVTPAHPARTEVCTRAAVQARSKAQAYAEALGTRLGALEEIREPGTGRHEPPDMFVQRAMMPTPAAMTARADTPPPQIEIEPGEMDVYGSVELTYVLER